MSKHPKKRDILGVQFPPDTLAALRRAAIAAERPVGFIIRAACTEWLASHAVAHPEGNLDRLLQTAAVAQARPQVIATPQPAAQPQPAAPIAPEAPKTDFPGLTVHNPPGGKDPKQ